MTASKPPADPDPCVDFDSALAAMGGDAEGLRAVCAVFLEEVPRTLAQITALAQAPREDALALIHEVANSLAVVGAFGRARALREGEMALRREPSRPLAAVLETAAADLRRAAEELRAYLAAAGPTP